MDKFPNSKKSELHEKDSERSTSSELIARRNAKRRSDKTNNASKSRESSKSQEPQDKNAKKSSRTIGTMTALTDNDIELYKQGADCFIRYFKEMHENKDYMKSFKLFKGILSKNKEMKKLLQDEEPENF